MHSWSKTETQRDGRPS